MLFDCMCFTLFYYAYFLLKISSVPQNIKIPTIYSCRPLCGGKDECHIENIGPAQLQYSSLVLYLTLSFVIAPSSMFNTVQGPAWFVALVIVSCEYVLLQLLGHVVTRHENNVSQLCLSSLYESATHKWKTQHMKSVPTSCFHQMVF